MSGIVRIGTRESRLAVIQAELVAAAVRKAGQRTELVTMKTTGDRILDKTLDMIGGKGLFVKELDEALRRGEADICAHSYKDMPAEDNEELPVVAVGPREDPRDVLILPRERDAMDSGKPIGCAGQRRQVQAAALFPGRPVAPIRGNVLTRLEKLDRGEYAALILAAAGMKRLGLWDRVARVFEPEELLPAGCQGIIAVQGRKGADYGYLEGYRDADALDASRAERAFIAGLSCGCGAPVGVYAQLDGASLRLRGLVAANGVIFREELTANRSDAVRLGRELADILKERSGASW